jgi:hypothetical protein
MLRRIINFNLLLRSVIVAIYYRFVKVKNAAKKILWHTENKFLFVLCPPYCGSTLLTELISTSRNVSLNNYVATSEGQQLPELKKMLIEDSKRWESDREYDWNYIKIIWLKYWDVTKKVLVEKSPPNIMRAQRIEQVFHPSYFICMVRDPYAHCEGLMRRNNWTAIEAADFAIKCLIHQQKNIAVLNNVILIKYEDLVQNAEKVIDEMKVFIKELTDISVKDKFKAHNFSGESLGLVNLNKMKIDKFSQEDLDAINNVFELHKDVLFFFNYGIITNEKAGL